MRINKEYCVTCGGLRSYVEDNPTQAANYPGQRIEVYPAPLNVTAAAPSTSLDSERICGCPRPAKV